jgi:GNAT superfamily N-acetyltransferase
MTFQTVRRVLPHEYTKYRHHLRALDQESRILRFGYPVTDYVIDMLCDKFEKDHDNNVLFVIENDKLEFIGVGHIALYDTMELAFSVLKEYQGQGMGNKLMHRSIQWCRTHGVVKGCMVCLSTNAAIRHLCSKYGIKMINNQGETQAEIELNPADAGTYLGEAFDSNVAAIDYFAKRAKYSLHLLS